jgi:hypothetical protein
MSRRNLEAYCGLYCGACPVYLQQYDGWLVEAIAKYFKCEPTDLRCRGCRSDMVSVSCRDCNRRGCAQSRGLDSCSACPEMPCDRMRQCRLPHMSEAVPNLEALRDRGSGLWLSGQADRWTCPSCGRTGSWYEQVCLQCGTALSSGHEPPEGV